MDVARGHISLGGWNVGGGRLADAAERYKAALAHADPEHYATPGYHQQCAGVLARS